MGSLRAIPSTLDLAEVDHALPVFVPELEAQAAHTFPDGHTSPLELRVLLEAAPESVVRNPAAEMMDVVDADVSGEPVADGR